MGKCIIGYRLSIGKSVNAIGNPACLDVIFEGEDFHCSPLHAIDSDETVRTLMTFLTLRPGDTDADYFADYTPEQREYCLQHAEALAYEVARRFGDS
jgi:hypothetical protein